MVCKGADTAMFGKIVKGKIEETILDIEKFSRIGLRTLVIATKSLTKSEFEKIKCDLEEIQLAHNKKEMVSWSIIII